MLVPIDIPPGVYANGTEYEAAGRWRNANLVRWYNGHLRPVGGWQRFTASPLTGIPRAVFTWRDNGGTARLSVGTESKLYIHDGSLAYDISPSDLIAGNANGNYGLGFGAGNYSQSTYGTPRPATGLVMDATVWDLDAFGQNLVALSPADGRILMWTPPATGTKAAPINSLPAPIANTPTTSTSGGSLTAGTYYYVVTAKNALGETLASNEVSITTTGSTSSNTITWGAVSGATSYDVYRGTAAGAENKQYALGNVTTFTDTGAAASAVLPPTSNTTSNAPTMNRAVIVTDERFVVAIGAAGDPRRIQWCSQEDYTQWTATATNTAGSLELKTNGIAMNGRKMPGETLIFTDVDVHSMQFVGTPFVYGINRIGTNCGLIGRKAHAATQNFCVWMGNLSFFIYDGVVRPLPCDVQEYVFDNLNRLQASKIVAGVNSEFGEVWWFYPSANSLENDSYVVWNYKENWWSIGQLVRTAWADREVWPYPIAASADSNLYQHEQGWTASGQTRVGTVFAESGPFDFQNGERVLEAKQLIPDTNNGGDASVNFTFKTRYTPTGTETLAGPYSFTRADGYVDVRFNGRQAKLRIDAATDGLFQIGTLRIDTGVGGKR